MDEFRQPKLKHSDHWLRLLLALLYFGLLFYVVKLIVGIVLLVQFFFGAFVGQANHRLINFSADLNRFSYHTLQYLTWNTDDRPFPFSDWPGPDDQDHVHIDP